MDAKRFTVQPYRWTELRCGAAFAHIVVIFVASPAVLWQAVSAVSLDFIHSIVVLHRLGRAKGGWASLAVVGNSERERGLNADTTFTFSGTYESCLFFHRKIRTRSPRRQGYINRRQKFFLFLSCLRKRVICAPTLDFHLTQLRVCKTSEVAADCLILWGQCKNQG